MANFHKTPYITYRRTTLLAVVVMLLALSPAQPQSSGNGNAQIILIGTALPAAPSPPLGIAQSSTRQIPSEKNPAREAVVLPATNVTAPLDDIFNGQIATIISCNGLTIGSFWSNVNWGDNSLSAGALSAPPGSLIASHIFTVANTFTVPISTTEKCVNMDSYGHGWTYADAVSATAVITVAPAAPPSAVSLSTASVVGGKTVTATINIASPTSTDIRLWLGVSNKWATVQPVVVIPSGQTTASVAVSTVKPSPSPQNVTISAVSGGMSRSAVLKVN